MRLIPDVERFGYLDKTESDSNESESKRKYKRISLSKRNQLLEKIFFENKKIKLVIIFSNELQNYSIYYYYTSSI
jgi:hypothetical protein